MLQLQGFISGQRPGRDVDLDVVLTELGLESRVVDMLQHPLVGHRGIEVRIDEVQLELEAHPLGARGEAVPGEHPGQRIQAALCFRPVTLQVLLGVDRIECTLAHPHLHYSHLGD